MKNNLNLDELEEFLLDSAEQHRMYPSDKVWRGINKELHGNRKWPALTFAAILTGAVVTAGLILIHPDKSLLKVASNESPVVTKQLVFSHPKLPVNSVSNFSDLKQEATTRNKRITATIVPGDIANSTSIINSDLGNRIDATENGLAVSEVSSAQNDATILSGSLTTENNLIAEPIPDAAGEFVDDQEPSFSARGFAAKAGLFNTENINAASLHINEEAANNAVSSIGKLPFKQNRWSSFCYITPSASYRYLAEAKVVDLHMQNGPIDPNYSFGVNNFVRHRQIAGLEIGGGLLYQASASLRIRMGLQANTRGYSIDAYSSGTQVSAIVLNRGYYTDSVMAVSNVNNFTGYQAINIQNRYFELSAPVSVDLKVAGKKKLELYVGAGLQPTYQFNKSMYIVSNDYKNYIREPNIARHFNLNTSLEAFLSYKAGKLTWQLGPQLRYQMLSGTNKAYPVREHLFDYGVKIGVVKSLK